MFLKNQPRSLNLAGKITLSLLLAGGSLHVSACSGVDPVTPNPAAQQQDKREASLLLRPHVISGKFKTLAIVENYTKTSVNHLVIKLFQLNGQSEVPLLDENGQQVMADLASSQLDQPITFHHLSPGTRYRVWAYAYKEPGTAPESLISTTDAGSCTDILMNNDATPNVSNLKVTLKDVIFNGQGSTSGTNVEEGGYSSKGPTIISKGAAAALVSTLAGTGYGGSTDGATSSAEFQNPSAIAVDAQGNLYVADTWNHRIRKITPNGLVSTLAGTGTLGYLNGSALMAEFYGPSGIAVDPRGTLYIADTGNNRIRKLTPDGQVSTLAGTGDEGYLDGAGNTAQFNLPSGIALDASDNLYVADAGNHRIRKVAPDGTVSTVAGSGAEGYAVGIGTAAAFNNPFSLTVDAQGIIYVADTWNNRIRKILPDGTVLDVAGSGIEGYKDGAASTAEFYLPSAVVVDAHGIVYVADGYNHAIRKIAPEGTVTTVAGDGYEGYKDARGISSEFALPSGLVLLEQTLFIADYYNHAIRACR